MPNWVVNKIEFSGKQEDINKVLDAIKGDGKYFDFNKLVLMPESLNIKSSSDNELGIICYISNKLTIPFEELKGKYLSYVHNMFDSNWARTIYKRLLNRKDDIDKLYELGKVCCSNIDNYGCIDWYDWTRSKWGTKWNACDAYVNDNILEFNTAQNCPLPVLDKLAELCYQHDVEFTGKWADEDMGCNTGVFESYCDGDEYEFGYEYMENKSREAYDIYVELHGESICFGRDEDGNFVHYDCDNCPNKECC